MSAITRVLILGLLSLLLASCRGGGDPMANIVSVTPTGNLGVTTNSVEFSADVNAPGSFTLHWDFGDGTDPSTITDLTPTVELLDPDSYEGSVQLLIDDVVVDTFPFEYRVLAPPEVTAVTPSGSVGLVRALVDFEATIEGDFDSLAWTFGDGANLLSQDEAAAQARILDPGTYTGFVTPTLDGVSGSAFEFEYTVDAPVAPTWTVQDVAPAELSYSDTGTSIVEHSGRLAVAFSASDGVRLARAITTSPCCPADWVTHVIDARGRLRGPQALISQGGRLVVAYRAQEDEFASDRLWIAVAQVEEPTSSGDWWIMDMEPFSAVALLARPGGTPVAATGGGGGLNFLIAQEEHPESAEDWLTHSIRPESEEGQLLVPVLSLAKTTEGYEIAALPYGTSSDSAIMYAHTDTDLPSDETDWIFGVADSHLDIDRSAFPIQGGPAGPQLLYVGRNLTNLVQHDLIVLQAQVENPADVDDWLRISVIQQLADGEFGKNATGAGGVWEERALLLRPDYSNRELLVFRQVRADATRVDAWEQSTIDSSGQPGVDVSFAITSTGIALAYLDFSSGQLRVAITADPY